MKGTIKRKQKLRLPRYENLKFFILMALVLSLPPFIPVEKEPVKTDPVKTKLAITSLCRSHYAKKYISTYFIEAPFYNAFQ